MAVLNPNLFAVPLLDTVVSSNFTTCLSDTKEVEEGVDVRVEEADGDIIQCTAKGFDEIDMIVDDCLHVELSMCLI